MGGAQKVNKHKEIILAWLLLIAGGALIFIPKEVVPFAIGVAICLCSLFLFIHNLVRKR